MNKPSLFEEVNLVENELDFLNVMKRLVDERAMVDRGSGQYEWENNTIHEFLERAHEWAEASIDGLQFYDKPVNPWRRCAQILYMGKIYE